MDSERLILRPSRLPAWLLCLALILACSLVQASPRAELDRESLSTVGMGTGMNPGAGTGFGAGAGQHRSSGLLALAEAYVRRQAGLRPEVAVQVTAPWQGALAAGCQSPRFEAPESGIPARGGFRLRVNCGEAGGGFLLRVVLGPSDVTAPAVLGTDTPVISPGSLVRLQAESSAMAVSVEAKAVGYARKGESVVVVLPNGRRITGLAVGPGMVSLPMF